MKFRYLKTTMAAVLLSVSGLANAGLIEIDFDDLSNGTVVGNNYLTQGVSFVDASITSIPLAGISAPNGINRLGSYNFDQNNPITAIFSTLVSSVSLSGYDVGSAGFIMKAYDMQVGGNLLQTVSFVGPDIGIGTNHTLSLNIGGIRRVEFSQILVGGGDGVVFDNFSFNTAEVPEPSTLAIFALGIMGLASRRFKKQS
jgi:hypothetical protein